MDARLSYLYTQEFVHQTFSALLGWIKFELKSTVRHCFVSHQFIVILFPEMPRASRAKGTKSTESKRNSTKTRTPAERVERLRGRLFSENTVVDELPSLLSSSLNTVSSAVLPALHGNAACSIVLLTGSRGCGKSTVVSRLLHQVAADSWECAAPVIVELHGLLHSGTNAAFRSIARALGGTGIGGAQHCLGEIGQCVTELRKKNTPILFVLDEFHRFVHVTQGQTVLYSIFNLLQDASLRGAAICITPHIDVTDHLEKRVKSRFSHRHVLVRVPKECDEVLEFLKVALLGEDGPPRKDDPISSVINAFFQDKSVGLALKRQFYRDRAIGLILDAVDGCLLSRLQLNIEEMDIAQTTRLAVDSFRTALEHWGSARDFILGLSTLELALVLALARMERRDAKGVYMFDDVYREYEGLATGGQVSMLKTQIAHIEPRPIAAKAWERVHEVGLVAKAGGSGGVRSVTLAVAPDVVQQALREHPAATTLLQRWGTGAAVQ